MNILKKITLGLFMVFLGAGAAGAQCLPVSGNITTSTVWTADNCYDLTETIYVMPGATLTIEAGTIVATTATSNGAGSLAVTRGGRIYVNGTEDNPVIMTSTYDVYGGPGVYIPYTTDLYPGWDSDPSNPTGRNPKTGQWHEGANEWGNLTLMGNAIIGYSYNGQPATPDSLSQADMEGLVAQAGQEDLIRYGGLDDDDNSGSISYLSIRYGGRVPALDEELNGLSLGAIGRATDINHVDIMNNIDDGIEIWGGTVNLKYVSIWNIGDDSFDLDQGWRGKAQFGLIVQGYSIDGDKQGSGVGDNCFETDGAEDSDAQPRTTGKVYNFTVIGQPLTDGGDNGTEWRDNARVQYRNMIFMDLAADAKLVKNQNLDGDGAHGYGYNGTASFASIWTTAYNVYPTINIGSADPTVLYQAQTDGMLAEIKDTVIYPSTTDLGDAPVDLGTAGPYNNVVTDTLPIASLTRNLDPDGNGIPGVVRAGKNMLPVTSLDPRAAGDAVTSVAMAPNDGFFTPVPFRGAFSPDNNWLKGWTAADAYGMTVTSNNAAEPATTIQLVGTVLSFNTANGVSYLVEESADGVSYAYFATVAGDGNTKNVSDLSGFSASKLYRVSVL